MDAPRFDKIKMPKYKYVLNDVARNFLAAFGKTIDDDGYLENGCNIWFYDSEKLKEDFPEYFNDILPFLELVKDGTEIDCRKNDSQ